MIIISIVLRYPKSNNQFIECCWRMLGFKKKIMTLLGKLNQQCLFDMKNVGNDRRCNTHKSRIAVVIVPLNPNECERCS